MNPINALGWTLLHFLWQGALVAVLLAGALAFLRHRSSRVRYAASCAAIVLMLVCAAATFLELRFTGERPSHVATVLLERAPVAEPRGDGGMPAPAAAPAYLPALVWAWFGGVLALSVRSLGGWVVAERFAHRHTWTPEAAWEDRFAALTKRLRISKPVTLVVSALAQVPAVVGWARPIVLVPACVFTGLSAEQIEALLAHELAHVRRHDYMVNMLQTAAETLFFYHPAVWWVNRNIRIEREHCCDDIAVDVCGSTVAYVRALTELEQMRQANVLPRPRLAMAADGGSLLNRAQRLLGMKPRASTPSHAWIASLGAVAALFVAGIAVNGLAQRIEPTAAPQTAEEKEVFQTWLDEIEAAGYGDLNTDQLIRLKEHGVDGEYIQEFRTAGLNLTADELVRFKEHGVTGDLVDQLNEAGLANLTADDVIRLSEHSAWEFHSAWPSLNFFASFGEHSVSVDFIKKLKQAGLANLTADDVIRVSEHGVDPGWLREIQSLGFTNVSADDLVRLSEHGVTPEFIREVDLKGLSIDQVVRLSEHGVAPAWIREIKSLGFANVSVDDLVRLSEHGVTPEFIREVDFKAVSIDEVVRLSEHGVAPAWIREIRSLGFAKVSADDLVRLSEHGVTPEFIREAQKHQLKDLSIDQLIRLQESGIL